MLNLFSISVSGEALAASTTETIIQGIASGSKTIELVRWGISFNGVTVTDAPVLIELMRFTSNGTSSAFTPVKLNPAGDSPLMTARTSHTAEPTPSDVLERYYVSPAGGGVFPQYAPDERILVPINGRLGIRVLSLNAVNVSAYMIFGE